MRGSIQSLTLNSGVTSAPIIIYLDVAPESSLQVKVNFSDSAVTASPSQLNFAPSMIDGVIERDATNVNCLASTILSFTLSSTSAGTFPIIYELSGIDADKYGLDTTTLLLGVAINNSTWE